MVCIFLTLSLYRESGSALVVKNKYYGQKDTCIPTSEEKMVFVENKFRYVAWKIDIKNETSLLAEGCWRACSR